MSDTEEKNSFQHSLSRGQEEVISFFCDGVRVLGLPRSIGEIYGLLYIYPDPLSLDDLVKRLGISKGSASQGLKFLRNLGAVHKHEVERKAYYTPELNLKQLVGGFIREEVGPHMESGAEKLKAIKTLLDKESDKSTEEFYKERHTKLSNWTKQAKIIFPLVQRVLGS